MIRSVAFVATLLLACVYADSVGVCKISLAQGHSSTSFDFSSLNHTVLSYNGQGGVWYVRLCGPWPSYYTSLGCPEVSAICFIQTGYSSPVSYGASKPSVQTTLLSNGIEFGYSNGEYCSAIFANRTAKIDATCSSSSVGINSVTLDSSMCVATLSVSCPEACGVSDSSSSDTTADKHHKKLALWISIGAAVLIAVGTCAAACCVYKCAQRKRCRRGGYSRLQEVACEKPAPAPHAPHHHHQSHHSQRPHSVVAPMPPMMAHPAAALPGMQPGMVYLVPYHPQQQQQMQQPINH